MDPTFGHGVCWTSVPNRASPWLRLVQGTLRFVQGSRILSWVPAAGCVAAWLPRWSIVRQENKFRMVANQHRSFFSEAKITICLFTSFVAIPEFGAASLEVSHWKRGHCIYRLSSTQSRKRRSPSFPAFPEWWRGYAEVKELLYCSRKVSIYWKNENIPSKADHIRDILGMNKTNSGYATHNWGVVTHFMTGMNYQTYYCPSFLLERAQIIYSLCSLIVGVCPAKVKQ